MTEQEERIEKVLFDLISNAGNMLLVQITNECSRSKDCKSLASIRYDKVHLILSDEGTLNEWAEAIVRAEQLCGELENKRIWERQNPIFKERIAARLRQLDQPQNLV